MWHINESWSIGTARSVLRGIRAHAGLDAHSRPYRGESWAAMLLALHAAMAGAAATCEDEDEVHDTICFLSRAALYS
jgi:hypothetical protein